MADDQEYQSYLKDQEYQKYLDSQKGSVKPPQSLKDKFDYAKKLTDPTIAGMQSDLPGAVGGGAAAGLASGLGKLGLRAAAGLGVAAPAAIGAYQAPEGQKLEGAVTGGLKGAGGLLVGYGAGKLASGLGGLASKLKLASWFKGLSPIEQNQQFEQQLTAARSTAQNETNDIRNKLKMDLANKPALSLKVDNFRGTNVEPDILRKQAAEAGFPRTVTQQNAQNTPIESGTRYGAQQAQDPLANRLNVATNQSPGVASNIAPEGQLSLPYPENRIQPNLPMPGREMTQNKGAPSTQTMQSGEPLPQQRFDTSQIQEGAPLVSKTRTTTSQTLPPEPKSHVSVQAQDAVDLSTKLGKRTFTQPTSEEQAHAIRSGQERNASAREGIRTAIENVHPEAGEAYDSMHEHIHNMNDIDGILKSKNPQSIDPATAQKLDETYGTKLQDLMNLKNSSSFGDLMGNAVKRGVGPAAGALIGGELVKKITSKE